MLKYLLIIIITLLFFIQCCDSNSNSISMHYLWNIIDRLQEHLCQVRNWCDGAVLPTKEPNFPPIEINCPDNTNNGDIKAVFVEQGCLCWHETVLIAKAKKTFGIIQEKCACCYYFWIQARCWCDLSLSELIGNPMFWLLFQPNQLPRTKAEILLLTRDDIVMHCKLSNCVVEWFNDQFFNVELSII